MSASEVQRPARVPDDIVEECEKQYWNHTIHDRRRARKALERRILPDEPLLVAAPQPTEKEK